MKILLVDDEQQVVRGVSRMLRSELEGWEIETANSGVEALELLKFQEFDAVVSDMRMPGMDGVELLEKIATEYPEVFRVILSCQASREAILRTFQPTHQYLSKPCDPDRLIEVLRRAEICQSTIQSDEVTYAIGQADCLPTLPESLSHLNEALDSESKNSTDIAEIVSQDPTLSAKILQIANSAIFGFSKPIANLAQAVSAVGSDMIRTVAMAQALFSGSGNSNVSYAEKIFGHSFECAVIARRIANQLRLDEESKYFVFSGALMHDVGKIVLVNAFPDRYTRLLEQIETGNDTWQAEMAEFGATHQGIGAYLLDQWGLPKEIIEAVATHHNLEICSRSGIECQVVFAANWFVNGADTESLENGISKIDERETVATFLSSIREWQVQLDQKPEKSWNE